MESFVWNACFVTGLHDVDEQHRSLVDLINAFGKRLSEHDLQPGDQHELIDGLFDYAYYHFREEEELMRRVGLDKRHFIHHVDLHHEFLDEVRHFQKEVAREGVIGARRLHEFLIHWLAYHILGFDQVMAGQIAAIEAGSSPQQAFSDHCHEVDPKTEPLLATLNALFKQMSERNRQLREFNECLEQKVEERTRELMEANRHLEEMALTDTLTGLPNRRHAIIALKTLWEESFRDQTPLACLMIDADHFKEINDTHGHDAGDAVLQTVARTLQHSVRTDDLVCRLGGDEFFVLCPNTNTEGAAQLGEKLRERVSQLRVPTGHGQWLGSISVGVGIRGRKMNSVDELIKAADLGVYAAKRAGKNCVREPDATQ